MAQPYNHRAIEEKWRKRWEDKPVNVFEDGMESRDFINIKDIVDGVIACLDNKLSNAQVINLGSGNSTSVIEIATKLKELYGSQSDIRITGDFRIGDIAHNKADISKARRVLGFEPKISLDEGLREFCTWVKGQAFDNSQYERSLSEMEQVGMFIRKQ